ncbi:hypothetical protein L873DRAFT_569949 [Choiromyces venosus 120613-1]|uniref:Uncharacterized protein n=1 Tax=Choiromyces venosus 120613-1 TaxID=1336337 RepID=A0A3N4K7R1_9PEZI|nr:hypothetical protein L873DRAFT_569949 [Choiromyces venosus 120613-1]
MLHTTSPGSKIERRTSSGAVTGRSRAALSSARNISGASASGTGANGHSRAVSDTKALQQHVHKISGPASPSLSAFSSPPPQSQHPPKKPSSLPDSSNIQPCGFDTLSVDSASVASVDSVGQPRVRRLCSTENRRPFVPPPCRQSSISRSSPSHNKDLGGACTGRLTEQALRDQEAIQRGDLENRVPKTHAAPYQTINSTLQRSTSQNFGEDTIMTSSPPEEYMGNGRDRPKSSASTYSDPTQKAEARSNFGMPEKPRRKTLNVDASKIEQRGNRGAENVAQGNATKAFGARSERTPFGGGVRAPGSVDLGSYEDSEHRRLPQPAAEGSKEKVKSTGGNRDSTSSNRPTPTPTASNEKPPFQFTTTRAEEKARSAQEQSDSHAKQHSGSPSNASRYGSSTLPRANSSPKDPKPPRQAISNIPSPSPDRHLSRKDKKHLPKTVVSPIPAKQQNQKSSHKRNATTSTIRTFSSEQDIGKARDERNRCSSAASVRTTTRGKLPSRSASAASTMEAESSPEVAPSEALMADTNFEHPIPTETLEAIRKESRTRRSSGASTDWIDIVSDHGGDFSSRKPARDKQRSSGLSSTNESTLKAGNYKDSNFETQAQESSPEINNADDISARSDFGGFAQSFLKRPSEADYEDLVPATGAGNVPTSRYTPTPSPSKRRDTRKKDITISRGFQEIKLARKSRLEEEDSDVDSLQYLLENDQDFSALFAKVDDDEDDTALLLANLPTYRPPAAQKLKVRPRVEAEAGDQTWEQERAVHEKLMGRLRTLHLEVRSATRGLDVLEGFLDGAGSSGDLSECWDDATQRKEYMRRLRKEEQNQRLILERRMRQRVALLGTPLPWSKWLVKWGFIAFLVVIVWYLLELAVFLHSMPPSYSSIAIERKPLPEFGALSSHLILKPVRFIFNSTAWLIQHGIIATLNLISVFLLKPVRFIFNSIAWLIQHGIIATLNLISAFLLTFFVFCKTTISTVLPYAWRTVTAIVTSLFSSSDQVLN